MWTNVTWRGNVVKKLVIALIGYRPINVLASTLAVVYALSVFGFVCTSPDIGIDLNFRRTVSHLDPAFVHESNASEVQRFLGWTLVELGDQAIDSWPHWTQALRDLNSNKDEGSPTVRIDAEGQKWVRVELQQNEQRQTIWCRVGHISDSVLLPSLLWIVLQTGLFCVAVIVFWNKPNDIGARMFYFQSLVVIVAYLGGYH